MPDITIVWNPAQGYGDWAMGDGDIQTGDDLETAVLVSLFTDRVATPDYVLAPGDTDVRGWWADAYNQDTIGSNIWQLERHTKTSATLNEAIAMASSALQWLIDDGVAAAVDVTAEWQGSEALMLAMAIAITEPSGNPRNFNYSWAWGPI